MVVFLTGASGFIGHHLARALAAHGHQVICAVRNPSKANDPRFRYVAADFTRDFAMTDWLPRLTGVDVVINAVGIIREQGTQTFDAIHNQAPRALFSACAAAGVRLVIQVSALGADERAQSQYHISKREADKWLAGLDVASAIVQPSLVFGPGGTSARLFTTLASLPLIGLPGRGDQQIQPVHIDDVVAAIVTLVECPPERGTRIAVVGPEATTLRGFLATLRHTMGHGRAHFLPMPMTLMRFAATAGKVLPNSLLDPETLQMLERGNTADSGSLHALLGRAPKPVTEFIPQETATDIRRQAQLNWLLPVLRISIAIVWIWTGIVSFGLYPVAESYALLGRVGITGILATVMLYGAAALDLGFGIATLFLRRRYWLWWAQIALILGYTAIISWRLPEFWVHPYGPLLKNLPMLAAIWMLLEMEKR